LYLAAYLLPDVLVIIQIDGFLQLQTSSS